MKKFKKVLVIVLIIIVLFLLLIICINKYREYRYIKLNDINDIKSEVSEDNVSNNIEENSNKLDLDNYRNTYNNDEIKGILSISNSDFEMLFAQSQDNSYYLDHLLNKEYNKLGSTFLDYRVDIDQSKKINIYGHNNGSVGVSFNYLMNYLDKNFYDEHRKIIINTNLDTYVYEIFSIQIVDSNYIHMKVDFNSDSSWYDYLNIVLNNSVFKEEIEVENISRVLTLQTCTNRYDGEFLLVNARLITV